MLSLIILPRKAWLPYLLLPLTIFGALSYTLLSTRAQGGAGTPPDAGLPDAARDATYQAASAASAAEAARYVRDFVLSGRPFETLPEFKLNVLSTPERYTIRGAMAAAAMVVRGVVTEQYMVLDPENPHRAWVVSRIRVKQALKGSPGSEVELMQPGTPITDGYGNPALGIDWRDPVVRRGEEVVVFAQEPDANGRIRTLDRKLARFGDGEMRTPSRYLREVAARTADDLLAAVAVFSSP